MTNPAEHIVERFGGLTKLARLIGSPVSTVQGWKERGKIPQEHWVFIQRAGEGDGLEIKLEEFLAAPAGAAA